MRALIVYDSEFGNTEKIARAIAGGIEKCRAETVKVSETGGIGLQQVSLLIVGSPTRGFRPTPAIMKFLEGIPDGVLNDVAVAAFDTRVKTEDIRGRLFRMIVDTGGYAANPIAERLRKKGGILVLPPEGFYVEGEKGPLKEGEEIRAGAWAKMACHA